MCSSCVTPILDYSPAVRGLKNNQLIDSVQSRLICYYLKVQRFAPIFAITGDMGWLPRVYRQQICTITYWNRLLAIDNDRLTKQVFSIDYSKCENNWCKDLKELLYKVNLEDYFHQKNAIDVEMLKSKNWSEAEDYKHV